MISKARVMFTRSSAGMFAARTSRGGITVFEMLGYGLVSRGDILSGEMSRPSEQEVYNETTDEELHVFIRECDMDVQAAVEKYFVQQSFVISHK